MTFLGQAQDDENPEEEVFVLSPFEVSGEDDQGYRATNTLAGTRINTRLEDIGSSVSVLTKDFLEDVGAVDNETVLAYALNTEVGGSRGNYSGGLPAGGAVREEGLFINPNGNTRVRGLSSADNTRNFFLTNIPWDGYNVERVDLQRGPNAILFGLGSPSGVVNASTNAAHFGESEGSADIRFDKFGSIRMSFDYNFDVIEDELAVRVAVLNDEQKFRQKPSFDEDQRFFADVKYQPKKLNSEHTLVQFAANYETGSIEANRPRTLAPYELVTAFFRPESEWGVNKQTWNATDIADRNALNSTSDSYHTALFAGFGGYIIHDGNALPTGHDFIAGRSYGTGTYLADGTISDDVNYGYLSGHSNNLIIANRSSWLAQGGRAFLPVEEQFWAANGFVENKTLQDTSILNIFNYNFEGPNKREYRDWDTYDLSFSNTYFGNKLGLNVVYHNESTKFKSYGLLGWNNTLYVDINETLSNVDIESGDLVATPNPNVGRAYFSEDLRFNTRKNNAERDSLRAQLYGELDLRDYSEGIIGKVFGTQRLNFLYEDQEAKDDNRTYNPAGFGSDLRMVASGGTADEFIPEVTYRHYVTGDLRDRGSASGLGIRGIQSEVFSSLHGPRSVLYWNPTWIGPEGTWGDAWIDPEGVTRTQSENAENYQGWTEETFNLYNILYPDEMVAGTDQTAEEYLLLTAGLGSTAVESKVGVWQGYFWDGAIVGTYGYREDRAVRTSATAPQSNPYTGHARIDPATYSLSAPNANSFSLETETTNWSAAVHVNKILGERDFLPLKLSIYYNEGENLQPAAGRLNDFGEPIPPPNGNTEEWSVLLATKDNKYSLRVTEYETRVLDQNLSFGLQDWAISQMLWFTARNRAEMRSDDYDFSDAPDPERLQSVVIPAYDAFVEEMDTLYPNLVHTWSNGTYASMYESTFDTQAEYFRNNPTQVSLTEDAVSKGMEFEFTANPTPNWRISANASKTKAVRDNAPGLAFRSMMSTIQAALENTPVGEFPLMGAGGAGMLNETRWLQFSPGWFTLNAINGQSQPEIREWRYNLVTNYSFRDGRFKGLGIGGSYRYEDNNIIEYPPKLADNGAVTVDIDNPIIGPDFHTYDLWVSYQRPLTDNIDWKIQLNAYNVLGKNELIAFNTDPDGVPNAVRIKEGASWTISNTFEF